MRSIRIASAARLALGVSPRPTDDAPHFAWLDLAGDTAEVAHSKLATVAAALAPRQYLQGEARLVVASGMLAPRDAAAVIARAIGEDLGADVAIGVVRGEELIDRIEELALAGCDLREAPGGPRLLDHPTPPSAVWAPTGAGPIAETLAAGATIVVTRAADLGTIGIAAAAEAFAWPATAIERYASAAAAVRFAARSEAQSVDLAEDASARFASRPEGDDDDASLPDLTFSVRLTEDGLALTTPEARGRGERRAVVAWLPEGAELRVEWEVDSRAAAARLAGRIEALADGVSAAARVATAVIPSDDAPTRVEIRCSSEHAAALAELAKRLELLSATDPRVAPLRTPLAERVRPSVRRWLTEAPTELLQYGVDVRPSGDWTGDSLM